MKFVRAIWLQILIVAVSASAAVAAISNISGFTNQADGNTVTAALWNGQIGSIYTYINSNLVSTLNILNTKGDILAFGSSHTRIQSGGAGNDGKVLIADSNEATGWRVGSLSSVASLTTKGDLLTHDGSDNDRFPLGTDGQVLVARPAEPLGLKWEANTVAVPQGGIIMWSGTIGSIPSGWALCDGGTHNGVVTPNLQGLFIVGAGNVSPAATGGMGLMNPGGPYGDASAGAGLGPTHSHTVSTTTGVAQAGGGQGLVVSVNSTGARTITPKYYALAFIIKT